MPNDYKLINSRVKYSLSTEQNNQHIKKTGDGTLTFMVWSVAGTALAACIGGGGGSQTTRPVLFFDGDGIIGTPRGDNIRGTNRNDIIVDYQGENVIDGRGGNDWIFASGTVRAGPGQDFVLGTEGDEEIHGDAGKDFIGGGGGNDIIRGGDGDDFVSSGSSGDNLADIRSEVPLENTIQRVALNVPVEVPDTDGTGDLPDIMLGQSTIYGDAGSDLVSSYTRATRAEPNLVFGDGDTQARDDGDDIIVTISHSDIRGGGGDDIFYLKVEQTGDLFRIFDFDVGDDKFLIISDLQLPTLQDIENIYTTFEVLPFDNDLDGANDSTRINATSIGTDRETYSGTVELIGFTRALERDDFLVMTASEFLELIADTGVGPDFVDRIISDLV